MAEIFRFSGAIKWDADINRWLVNHNIGQRACRNASLFLILVLSLTTQAAKADTAQGASPLQELANAELKDQALPGISLAIAYADGGIETAVAGYADIEAQLPLKTTHRLAGGSTGKTFVAAIALNLVRAGTLTLSDPISKWLGDKPWFDELPNANTIRVEHLLNHSSGISDHVDSTAFLLSSLWQRVWSGRIYASPDESISYVLNKPPLFEPGQGFAYTDTGYLLLGLIIERAAGRSYYELLQEHILTPQSLVLVSPATSRTPINHAIGYATKSFTNIMVGLVGRTFADDGMIVDPAMEWTGGGLATTPAMLARFYWLLGNGQIVPADTFTRMVDSGYVSADPTMHYGYGLYVWRHGGVEHYGHGGWFPGFRTRVDCVLDTTVCAVVQVNTDAEVDLNRITDAVLKTVEPNTTRR